MRAATVCLIRTVLTFLTCTMFIACTGIEHSAWAAPKADLWPYWKQHEPDSTKAVDHSRWADFLTAYLVTGHPSGINRVRYGFVTAQDKSNLERYVEELQSVPVSSLNRTEQKAFWVNAYNALVVKTVLDHYPVETILDIDISGWFANGPWKAKLLTVEGKRLSLNDIEHRILRPIWNDNRIHYVLNCASISCPNLQAKPLTADNMEKLLEKEAREYVNHPRAIRFPDDGTLKLSSIYKWYQEDFGDSFLGVIQHALIFAHESLAERLRSFQGDSSYEYDWRLNEP